MAAKWRTVRLGEITDWASGGTPPKDDAKYWGGTIPWISASSMYGNRYSDSELKLTEAGLARGSRLAEVGTVLLLVRGSMLHQRVPVGIATRSVAFNQDVKAIKAKEGLSPWFLFYWFLGNERNLLELVDFTGIGAGKFDTKQLQELPVNLPTLAEQELIVAVAKALDDKIELNRGMNETLEAIARAIFKSWFVDFDPVRAKASGEPPESICRRLGLIPDLLALFPDRLVDSELGEIPEGWEQKRVDDLMELAYGKALKASDRVDGPVPVYGSGGITGYHSEHLVDGPGIIVGRKGTVGSLYWEDRSFFPIDTVFYVVPKVQLTYCYYLLQTLSLDRMNTDAAVPGLNRNNVYRLPVAWSPVELRNAFDRVAKALRDRLFANNQESQTLENIRDSLLPKLLSGELRVPVAGAA